MRFAAAFTAAALASGCATAMLSPHKSFRLESVPDGARFEVRDTADPQQVVREGTTPAPLFLSRGSGWLAPAEYTIQLTKEGYQPHTVALPTRVSEWYWANVPAILLGVGVLGLIVDPIDGAMWELEAPGPVTLAPLGQE